MPFSVNSKWIRGKLLNDREYAAGQNCSEDQNTPMTVYHNTPMTTNTSATYSDTKFSTLSTDED